jgi:hypothetical protein
LEVKKSSFNLEAGQRWILIFLLKVLNQERAVEGVSI